MTMKKALVQMACAGWTALAVSLAQGETIAYWPDIAITTNALPTASWGYTVDHLGEYHNETAVVITNGTATWTAPAALENVRFLVVGGGGGGGGDVNASDSYQGGAGGGGGGVVTGVVYSIAQGATISATVGDGGAGGEAGTAVSGKYGAGKAGSASSFTVGDVTYVTANGGGQDGGSTSNYSTGGQIGGSGGSSAGSRPQAMGRGAATKGSVGVGAELVSAVLFGTRGGAGVNGVKYVSGGGGGATEEGGTPSDYGIGGKGGEGLASDITGTLIVYGSGGGGGSAVSGGGGGLGGTGAGDGHRTGNGNGENALPNQGGGGGGGGGRANGGNGGSGIVVLRYVAGSGVIMQAEVSALVQNPEYTGEAVSCGLAETKAYTVSGTTATNPGDYAATVTPKAGYVWDDGTTDPIQISWSIPAPVAPDIAITTNALSTASWGYTVNHLGEFHNETAVVFTNGTAMWTAPAALENVRFLVVGGGGGGGGDVNASEGYQGGAGGGGGGVVTGVVYSIAQNATIAMTVGGGGAGGTVGTAISSKYGAGKAGSASSFKVNGVTYVTANGGGQDGGSSTKYSTGGQVGGSGGSSAGSRPQVTERGTATKGSIGSSATSLLSAALFGTQGGAGLNDVKYVSGGGGGATEEGGTPSDYETGGKGGEGLASDITGVFAVYGSGGGGGTAVSGGVGGLAGTGAGDGHRTSNGNGENALPNQGGGGGGGGGRANGGNGGSGIVVLRYVATDGVIVEAEVSALVQNPEYTGETVSCGLAETAGYTVSGATATNPGDYAATVTPKAGYVWDDGIMGAKTFSWSVTVATPQVAGENVAPAEVFTKAKVSKPIVYPTEPTVTGEVGSQVISFGGVDVNVPDYYTASKSGNVVSLVLNDNAKPVITDEDETPGIAIEDGKVHIHLGNVKSALYYTILSATSLDVGEWTPCGEAEQGQDDFEYNASGPLRFYKASVRDEAE